MPNVEYDGFCDCLTGAEAQFIINPLNWKGGFIASGAKMPSGNKPVVVCNGQVHEAGDLKKAQEKAEQLAHQHQTEAFILKPVKKVAPKREVVTTDIDFE